MNGYKSLLILKYLMTHESATTRQLTDYADCERKTVYKIADALEVAGFPIAINKVFDGQRYNNVYSYSGEIMGHGEL